MAAEGSFNKKNIEDLLNSLYECKDEQERFLDLFDKIPANLLKIVSNQFVDEFKPILEAYTTNLDYLFSNSSYNFAYAETIAYKMQIVYINSKDMEHKKLALKNILIYSYLCNRWSAMDVFDRILSNITETSEAMAIAEMLKEEISYYRHFANRLQRHELHSLIQVIQSEALGEVFERDTDYEIKLP